ncbi:spore germination protein [Cohnella caldifontis]|uniref:spore germination protein n=1 Tax=Cohnella caldifontis TaxID=3027471 RepID=UPI0023EAD021|nr:spore germination protein [Cohnella sp. YIM B05605]
MTPQAPEADRLSADMHANRRRIEHVFSECFDIQIQPWHYGPDLGHAAVSVYCRSIVNEKDVHTVKQTLQSLVPHELGQAESISPEQIGRYFGQRGVSPQPYRLISTIGEAQNDVLEGYVVLIFDGWDQAISYLVGKFPKRQVTEPVNEPVVHGPREGTIEDLDTNLGMLRQRLKTPRLKMESLTVGDNVSSKVVYVYLAHAVDLDMLAEFRRRLAGIERCDAVSTSYVEQWIEDHTWTPFPQHRYTERTDTAAAALLDGKILVLMENSPTVLICPALFVEFFGTSEDYYVRTSFATLVRWLRILAYFMAASLPSLYIAISTFHPELFPTVLLLAVLDSREGIPFPAFFEAMIMEISFELLREAGIRLPRPVGPAVSIVGALVIGQAAISAKIASPIMVIVVALTGIASFSIPHYDMGIALRIVRFPLMVSAGILGLFGMMIAYLLLFLHLTCLHTLGRPYLSGLAPLKLRDMRDILIRAPLRTLMRSPRNRRLNGGGPAREGAGSR